MVFSLFQRPTVVSSTDAYPALLERALRCDPDLNFFELRQAYTQTADYRPYRTPVGHMKAAYRSLDDGNSEAVAVWATKLLQLNYVDLDCHELCRRAALISQDAKQAAHHSYMVEGLLSAICGERNGRSRRGAYIAICVSDEYAVARIFGLQVLMQQMTLFWGRYDILWTLNPKTGSKQKLYFNIESFSKARKTCNEDQSTIPAYHEPGSR